ncbi:MAG: HAD family phosphatase [Myxococcota bacterium]|nr:HAD family phosphatase [Myxococcota bacterium]
MVYLFDVMSTLVYDPFLKDVPKAFGISLSDFFRGKDRYAWVDFENNLIDEAGFAKRFSSDGQAAYRMRDVIFENYRWNEGMKELLISLRAEGHTLCTLSNYPVWYEFLDDKVGLSQHMDHSFVSYRMGVRKPDPLAYTIPLNTLNIDAKDAIFIDDRFENCAAARLLGMRAIQFQNIDQLLEELEH